MVDIPDWAGAIVDVITADDPLAAADMIPHERRYLDDLNARLYFEAAPSSGLLAREIVSVDRAFRYGARRVETGLSAGEFRSRPRPPILPLADGLVITELTFGSVDIRFASSLRIRRALVGGLVVVGTAVTYLNDGFGVADRMTGAADEAHPVYLVRAPGAPCQLDIEMTRGEDLVKLVLQSPDGRVYTLSDLSRAHVTPHPQLAGLTR